MQGEASSGGLTTHCVMPQRAIVDNFGWFILFALF